MSPCLDFPRSCDILFLAGAFSALSRVLSVRCRAVARGRLLFLHHIKTARADLRAGGQLVKEPRSLCARRRQKSEIIFSRDMCVRENTAQAASVEFVRHRHTNSARSRLQALCRKTAWVFRQFSAAPSSDGAAFCAFPGLRCAGRWAYNSGI